MKVTAKMIADNINHPQNALNLEMNAHNDFDKFRWGIEAELQENMTVSCSNSLLSERFFRVDSCGK
jgi:hypothetical protein